MKKISYICDKCKREFKENPVKVIVEEVDRENEDFLQDDPYPELKQLDFCKDCGDFIVGLIKCTVRTPITLNDELRDAVNGDTCRQEESSGA